MDRRPFNRGKLGCLAVHWAPHFEDADILRHSVSSSIYPAFLCWVHAFTDRLKRSIARVWHSTSWAGVSASLDGLKETRIADSYGVPIQRLTLKEKTRPSSALMRTNSQYQGSVSAVFRRTMAVTSPTVRSSRD